MNRLNTRSWARASGLLISLLASVLSFSFAAASDGIAFSGSVTDALGNIIEDVEVLAVTMGSGPSPAATVHSDHAGRFRFESLAPGTYRIVALKKGYLTFVGSVNTQAQSWVKLILHPAPPPGSEGSLGIPSDPAWVLRLPRRSILRELDDRLPAETEERPMGDSASRTVIDDRLHMRVDQLFSTGPNLWSDNSDDPWLRGMETRLDVASMLGERGRLEFSGSRKSYAAAIAAADPAASSKVASSLELGLSYDTSLDSRLAVQAFFSEQDMSFHADAGGAALPQERRKLTNWGYDARWSSQIDALSSMELRLDYRDRSLDMPDGPHAVSGRAIGASGSYIALPAAGHQVEVDFNARLLDSPAGALPVHEGELNRRPYEPDGLSFGLDAQDTWHVSGPLTFVYGMGFRYAEAFRDTSLIVPRMGAACSFDRLIMRFLVSYNRAGSWGTGEPSALDPDSESGDMLGYEAEVELPLAAGINLKGASFYSPVDVTQHTGYGSGSGTAHRPLYFSDGNASVERRSLSLISERAGSRITLEMGAGRVEGFVAPASLDNDSSFFLLSDGRLRYRTGKLGIDIPVSGTSLLFDWRKVLAGGAESGQQELESARSSIAFQVAQELVRLRTAGCWRVLVALQKAELEVGDGEDPLTAGYPRRRPPANHQVSAGLSVLF